MPIYAGHLPTKKISHSEWLRAAVYSHGSQDWPEDGLNRTTDANGKPVVFFRPPLDSGEVHWAARPIVRVKMGRG